MIKIQYDKQTYNTPNIIARYAHIKRNDACLKIALGLIKNKKVTLLDYGCGDGYFLNLISKHRTDISLVGYDPHSQKVYKNFKLINNLIQIHENSIDLFCCFETLEHLNNQEKIELFSNIEMVVKKLGNIIISVPIIGGPPLLFKEINRAILFKRKTDYSFKELFLASFFGISAKRAENIKTSHKGFNFKELKSELEQKFEITSITFSPFYFLPWFFNAHVLFSLRFKA